MSARVAGGGRGAAVVAASERRVEQSIALIDYDALNEDEISFRAGDVINVTGKGSASGFWEGYVAVPTYPALATAEVGSDTEREGSSSTAAPHPPTPLHGLFPNCLVTSNMRFKSTMANYIFQNIALCLYSYRASGEGEMSFEPGDVITALRPSASPGWWYGVRSSETPWTLRETRLDAAPTTRFADPTGASPPPASSAANTAHEERLFPTNFVTCDVVLITFNFSGRQAHELSCRGGDVVQVHRRWNDGWWEGSLRGRRGIFPSNYSVPNICTTSPPLFCARCRSVYASNTFQTTCETCAAEERVEDVMLQSLEAFARGEVAEYDLFAGIEVGPLGGPGQGGDPAQQGESSSTAADDGGAASGSGQRSGGIQKKVRGSASAAGSRKASGGSGERPKATLLTDKDLADLASNRVKLME